MTEFATSGSRPWMAWIVVHGQLQQSDQGQILGGWRHLDEYIGVSNWKIPYFARHRLEAIGID